MTYEQALDYLHSLSKGNHSSKNAANSRTGFRLLLKRLGNPQERIKWIHIAGTNGKGSTAAFCYHVLNAAGYCCGMFSSPFISDFRERFQLGGQMIGREVLTELTEKIKPILDSLLAEGEVVTEFEAVTALGFLWFDGRAEIVCLETGIGGKNDATNVIPSPLAAVITSISLDHTAILGNQIEQIAAEKAGIIKPESVCVCYPKLLLEVMAVLMERCAETGVSLRQANPSSVEILESGFSGSRFVYREVEYEISLCGEHQIWNALTVIELMETLAQRGFPVSLRDLKRGLKNTRLPARMELLHEKPDLFLDGAHNLEGMQALSKMLSNREASRKIALVGMMRDKDDIQALKQLCSQVDEVICVQIDNPRALPCEQLAETAKAYLSAVSWERDFKKAVCRALCSLDEKGLAVVCGSFYLAGEVRNWILEQHPFSEDTETNRALTENGGFGGLGSGC